MKPIRIVHVDGHRCTAHKLCLNEAPSVLEFDVTADVAAVKEGAKVIFEAVEEDIRAAIAVCPMKAIGIREAR